MEEELLGAELKINTNPEVSVLELESELLDVSPPDVELVLSNESELELCSEEVVLDENTSTRPEDESELLAREDEELLWVELKTKTNPGVELLELEPDELEARLL